MLHSLPTWSFYLALLLDASITHAQRTGYLQLVPAAQDRATVPIAFEQIKGFYLSRELTIGFSGNLDDIAPLRVTFVQPAPRLQYYIEARNAEVKSNFSPPFYLHIDRRNKPSIWNRSFSFVKAARKLARAKDNALFYPSRPNASQDLQPFWGDVQRFCFDSNRRNYFRLCPYDPSICDTEGWEWNHQELDELDAPGLRLGDGSEDGLFALDFIFVEDSARIHNATNEEWEEHWRVNIGSKLFHRIPDYFSKNVPATLASFIVAPSVYPFNQTLQYDLTPRLTVGDPLDPRSETGRFWVNVTGELSPSGEPYYSITAMRNGALNEHGLSAPEQHLILEPIASSRGSPSHQIALVEAPETVAEWMILGNNILSHRFFETQGANKTGGFYPIHAGGATLIGSSCNSDGTWTRRDRLDIVVFPLLEIMQ